MGWAYAAGRKHIIKFGTTFINGLNNDRLNIGNHPCLLHPYTELIQCFGEIVQIRVLSSPRKNFVADDDHATRDNLRASFC